jgi:tetratricopeptide (TPR) repeat protein
MLISRTAEWRPPSLVVVVIALPLIVSPPSARAQQPEVTAAGQVEAESERQRAEAEPDDPTRAGRDLYFRGAGQVRRAQKLTAKAAKAEGAKRSELEAEAHAAYEAAVEALGGAVRANPALRDAYVSLGVALRALGRAEEAVEVHALALRRDGRDDENFRGYVESLLALHRLGNVTALHDQLLSDQPKRAEMVLEMLRRFHAERAKSLDGLAPDDLARLAAWLDAHATG